jgi:DHA1 family bicyclomycin/chloramphenicol resistance-like MFS transporter
VPRLRPHSIPFTLLLASLVTLASFATDMGLPVLAATAASLGVAPGTAALTLGVFLAGFAFGPLLFGPLSDGHGRRPVLLTGSAMFAVFGGLAAFAQSLDALLVWRFLMGTGAGACQVTVIAMVRDLFTGTEARVKQSYVNLAAGVAPVIAPTVGVAIATLGGWRAIYGALAAGGAVLFLVVAEWIGESAPMRQTHTIRTAIASYVTVLRHRVTLGYILMIALNFGCLFAYVSGSSLVLIGQLSVSRRLYGVLFAATSAGLMIGALTSARLSRRGVSHARLIAWGLAAIVVTSTLLVAITMLGGVRVWSLVSIAFVGFVGQGVVKPNATQGALEPMAPIAGVASAVMSGIQMLAGAAASASVAALIDARSALAMTGIMAVCAGAALLVYVFVVRPAELIDHSYRSASTGSTLAARRAGM